MSLCTCSVTDIEVRIDGAGDPIGIQLVTNDLHELTAIARRWRQIAAGVIGGVARALGLGDLVDEHALAPAQLGGAPEARARL
jgi:hypothetical protein